MRISICVLYALVFVNVSGVVAGSAPAFVSPRAGVRDQRLMSWKFSSFIHFNLDTFLPNETNCIVRSNYTGSPWSPDLFAPSDALDTDAWVRGMKSIRGVNQICLTVHHSSGFTLWPTKHSNFSIAASPYWKRFRGRDPVAEFVASCRLHGVSPCFYIAPEADCHLAMQSKEVYLSTMLGYLTELLTAYGPIDRLWLDTIWAPLNYQAPPPYRLPRDAWHTVLQHIAALSPDTVLAPGPDGCEMNSPYNYGRYPFYTANVLPPVAIDGSVPGGPSWDDLIGENCWTIGGGAVGVTPIENVSVLYSGPPQPLWFRAGEEMLTIVRDGSWFWHSNASNTPQNEQIVLAQWFATVMHGQNFILNVPADRTGQLAGPLLAAAQRIGAATEKITGVLVARSASLDATDCRVSVSVDVDDACFNAIYLAEDLSGFGQSVVNYTVFLHFTSGWPRIVQLPPADVPGPVYGQVQSSGRTIGARQMDIWWHNSSSPRWSAAKKAFCGVSSVEFLPTACLMEHYKLSSFLVIRSDPSPLGW